MPGESDETCWIQLGEKVLSPSESIPQSRLTTGSSPMGLSAGDYAGVLANDLCLTNPPRKAAPGRLANLLQLVSRAAGRARAGIALMSPEGDLAEHLTYGMVEAEATALERSTTLLSVLQCVLRQPTPTRLVNVRELSGHANELAGFGPFLAVPLKCAGRNRGVLYLLRSAREPEFTAEDEDLLVPIGAWLDQAKLSEETRLLSRLRVLNEVAQAAAGNLDLTSILTVTLRELDRLLPLHVGAVWLLEETEYSPGKVDETEPTLSTTVPQAPPVPIIALLATSRASEDKAAALGLHLGLRLGLDESPFGDCLREGRPFYADLGKNQGAHEGDLPPLCRSLAAAGAVSCFAVPLRAGQRTVGILQSVCTRPGGFTGEQLQILYLVADLLGPAISNCQLFRRLRTANDELRRTQSQLIQAEKMRALGELASGVAHEFNNSLCGVLGFLELALLNQSLDSDCRGFLESARTCAMDAAQTVRRVQDFARWRRHEMTCQLIDFPDFVRDTVDLIRHKWESPKASSAGSIVLVLENTASARISGNPAELREVLTNLAFNAVDAMPRGGTLTIRTWNTPTDAFVAVRDTGIGISPAVRHRLFEPFFTTKGEHGNGLGLSVAFGIVRRHAGEITVESDEGHGAKFTVRLPVESTTAARAPKHSTPRRVPAGRSLSILVVEDEASIRDFLDTGLAHLGHRAWLAADVEEGTAAIQRERFDVVLTDLGLPGASGEEMAQRVAERSPGTPVLLLTGWAEQIQAEKRSIPGVTRVLSKPVSLEALAEALAAVAP